MQALSSDSLQCMPHLCLLSFIGLCMHSRNTGEGALSKAIVAAQADCSNRVDPDSCTKEQVGGGGRVPFAHACMRVLAAIACAV